MTAQQLARVGFALMGVYLIVKSLVVAADSLSARPLVVRESDAPFADHLNSLLFSGSAALAAITVFGFAPGAVLIAKSRRWAESLFPDAAVYAEIPIAVLLPMGLLLLGLDFGISGLSSLLGGIVQIIASDNGWSLSYAWRTLATGAVSFLGGVALFSVGRRLARHAAFYEDAPVKPSSSNDAGGD